MKPIRTLALIALLTVLPGVIAAGEAVAAYAPPQLDGLDTPVQMNFNKTSMNRIFEAIGKAAGFEVEFEGLDETRPISIDVEKTTLDKLLTRLAKEQKLSYRTPDSKTLVVMPAKVVTGL